MLYCVPVIKPSSPDFKSTPLFWALWIWRRDSQCPPVLPTPVLLRPPAVLPFASRGHQRYRRGLGEVKGRLFPVCSMLLSSFLFPSASSSAAFSPWLRRFLLVAAGKASLQFLQVLRILRNVSTISAARFLRRSQRLEVLWAQTHVHPLSSVWVSSPGGASSKGLVSTILNFIRWVFFNRDFIHVLERGEGREKEGEKHGSVASGTCANQGLNPQTRHVPWAGIELATFHQSGVSFVFLAPGAIAASCGDSYCVTIGLSFCLFGYLVTKIVTNPLYLSTVSSPSLSAGDVLQDPQWMPETLVHPYIYQTLYILCFFLYIPMIKFNL